MKGVVKRLREARAGADEEREGRRHGWGGGWERGDAKWRMCTAGGDGFVGSERGEGGVEKWQDELNGEIDSGKGGGGGGEEGGRQGGEGGGEGRGGQIATAEGEGGAEGGEAVGDSEEG